MNRLTTRRADNGLAYLVGVKPNEQEVNSPHPNTLRCILDCFERLADYEDTGLTPEEIEIMFRAHTALRDMKNSLLSEIKQVKKERDRAIEDTRGYCVSCAFVRDCAKHDNNDAAPPIWYYGDCEEWQWRGLEVQS